MRFVAFLPAFVIVCLEGQDDEGRRKKSGVKLRNCVSGGREAVKVRKKNVRSRQEKACGRGGKLVFLLRKSLSAVRVYKNAVCGYISVCCEYMSAPCG